MRFHEFVERKQTDALIDYCARLFAETSIEPDGFILNLLEQEAQQGEQQPAQPQQPNIFQRGYEFVKGLFADKYQKALKALKNLEQFLNGNKAAAELMSTTDRSKSVKDWVSMIAKQLEGEKELAGLAAGGGQQNPQEQPNAQGQQTQQNQQAAAAGNQASRYAVQPHLRARRDQTSPRANATTDGNPTEAARVQDDSVARLRAKQAASTSEGRSWFVG